MGKTKFLSLIWIMLMLLSTQALAQTYYVGDTLRVGIRPEPINGGPSIAVVSSGTPLEVLERKGRHVKVRSPNGVEGWVKSAYITSSKPAQILFEEASSKVSQLEKEISALKKGGGNNVNSVSNEKLAQLEQEKQSLQNEVDRLRKLSANNSQSGGLLSDQSILEFSSANFMPVYFLLGALVFILSLGFLFGVTWHKHQVTKRLGGLSL